MPHQLRLWSLFICLLAVAAGAPCGRAQHVPPSPYAGDVTRPIKALSGAEIDAYLTGAGMGLARAAELNHYPGPRHVLDLADSLDLSAEQREQTRAIFDAMQAQAISLGRELVARERSLDSLFAAGTIDENTLHGALRAIGERQAELRFVHLRAHLQTKALLTPQQIRHYDRLRGYAEAAGHHHAH